MERPSLRNAGRFVYFPGRADFRRFERLSRLDGVTYHFHKENALKRKFAKNKETPEASRDIPLVRRFNPLETGEQDAGNGNIKNYEKNFGN